MSVVFQKSVKQIAPICLFPALTCFFLPPHSQFLVISISENISNKHELKEANENALLDKINQ